MSKTERACIMGASHTLFEQMTSLEHLFHSWDQFKRGKRKKEDVQFFERHLEDHIFQLHQDLVTCQYQPEAYAHFYVTDPKQRYISKASLRDRLVHQLVYNTLVPIFDQKFIFHSLSSRSGKGTHVGISYLRRMIRKVSRNGTRPCYALKMDIRRFFDTVNHSILKTLIQKRIQDEKLLHIIHLIIDGFQVTPQAVRNGEFELRERSRDSTISKRGRTGERYPPFASIESQGFDALKSTVPNASGYKQETYGPIGIPLGNSTSQLFANIYLNELDDFIKQQLRESHYLRYCDDFIILSPNEKHLKSLIAPIQEFLTQKLRLGLHPKKLTIRKLSQGIDFVGSVLFEKHTLLRTRTKQRMKKRLKKSYAYFLQDKMDVDSMNQRLQSYLGILSHTNQHTLSQALKNAYWVRRPPDGCC